MSLDFFYLDADEKVEKYDEAEVKHLIEVSHQTLWISALLTKEAMKIQIV